MMSTRSSGRPSLGMRWFHTRNCPQPRSYLGQGGFDRPSCVTLTHYVELIRGSEEKIRELFSKAKKTAPSIIFIDEIDAIASKRENSQQRMETRIVTQLLTCMEGAAYSRSSNEPTAHVLVIGATNRIDEIDSALRRPGRFDREILVGIPDESAREEILLLHTSNCNHKLDDSIDLRKIARSTPGFVGADLEALVGKVSELAFQRVIDEVEPGSSNDEGRWKEHWSPQQ
ncbi:hypothetical protein TSUD_151800 [Trifolium subterraneum]|uniref:AAA+ ATPase domain-containing protein n=1 Tax=Trifolium subterraneum TaxID=3900 RepID=A0A2Z6P7M6_TRISU|nr:hypothetical protein TSUD_151800 [Trifolium subterraneum]